MNNNMFKITPSYWCTWSTQNRNAERLNEEVKKNNPAAFLGDQGAQLARATMNEESIFSQGGGGQIISPKSAAICSSCSTTAGT